MLHHIDRTERLDTGVFRENSLSSPLIAAVPETKTTSPRSLTRLNLGVVRTASLPEARTLPEYLCAGTCNGLSKGKLAPSKPLTAYTMTITPPESQPIPVAAG